MPAESPPRDWVEADVRFQDPSTQTSRSQLQLVGPSALPSQQPATGELAANLLAYANQLQQLPPQLPGDVRERVQEEIADKLLEYADQLRQLSQACKLTIAHCCHSPQFSTDPIRPCPYGHSSRCLSPAPVLA